MKIDMEVADLIMRIIQWLVLPALGLLVRSIMQLRKDINDHKSRIDKLEQCQDSTPTEKALHKLETAITEQGGDLKAIRESVDTLKSVVTRHDEFLLQGGKQ